MKFSKLGRSGKPGVTYVSRGPEAGELKEGKDQNLRSLLKKKKRESRVSKGAVIKMSKRRKSIVKNGGGRKDNNTPIRTERDRATSSHQSPIKEEGKKPRKVIL